MSEHKEKSAVGEATPATEKVSNYTESVAHNSNKIKCVIQKPGEISKVIEVDEYYPYSDFEQFFGGYIDIISINRDFVVIVDYAFESEELKANIAFNGRTIHGTIIVVADHNGDGFNSMTTAEIQAVRAWLLKHTI